jgi:predicted Zn-ribbon and HTH transcriptional regulator
MSLLKEKCKKCGYERILRIENPKKCPKCGHNPTAKIYTPRMSKKAEALPRKENRHSQQHRGVTVE